jgi:flavin reductase (DIM6/NTAB) family NADH-FMN oxidoreductase RutF
MLPELSNVNDDGGNVDVGRLRKVFGRFPTGVTAICVVKDGTPIGFAASSFNTVSVDPPLVSLAVQTGSETWPHVQGSQRIGVSVFASDQSLLCRQMASKTGDRFAGAAWTEGEGGSLLLAGAAAWMECSIEFERTVGDHEVVILRVHRHGADPDLEPLVFGDSKFQPLKPIDPPKPGDEPGSRAVQESLLSLSLGWW